MSEQESTFRGRALFKGRDTSFGIFYPTNYIIAVFDSYETAKHAINRSCSRRVTWMMKSMRYRASM
jgi:hypothetical protein